MKKNVVIISVLLLSMGLQIATFGQGSDEELFQVGHRIESGI